LTKKDEKILLSDLADRRRC
jgi:hypothetical protein